VAAALVAALLGLWIGARTAGATAGEAAAGPDHGIVVCPTCPYPYPIVVCPGCPFPYPFPYPCTYPPLPPPPPPPGVTVTPYPSPTPLPSPTPGGMASTLPYRVCPQMASKIPAEVQQTALAQPWMVYGYNMRQNPNIPYHPLWNPYRSWLSLRDWVYPYGPCNTVVWKSGCP
jgi:hypothetical protein